MDRRTIGIVTLLAGIVMAIFGYVRFKSTAVQFAGMFGATDTVSILLLVVGASVTIGALIIIATSMTKRE